MTKSRGIRAPRVIQGNQKGGSMSRAIDDVLAERKRQIEIEGWSAAHDDKHDAGDLACAAASYALNAGCQLNPLSQQPLDGAPVFWPWHTTFAVSDGHSDPQIEASEPAWWKPKDARRDLVRAAALIIAEIERIDRGNEVLEIPAFLRMYRDE